MRCNRRERGCVEMFRRLAFHETVVMLLLLLLRLSEVDGARAVWVRALRPPG